MEAAPVLAAVWTKTARTPRRAPCAPHEIAAARGQRTGRHFVECFGFGLLRHLRLSPHRLLLLRRLLRLLRLLRLRRSLHATALLFSFAPPFLFPRLFHCLSRHCLRLLCVAHPRVHSPSPRDPHSCCRESAHARPLPGGLPRRYSHVRPHALHRRESGYVLLHVRRHVPRVVRAQLPAAAWIGGAHSARRPLPAYWVDGRRRGSRCSRRCSRRCRRR